MHGGLPGVAVEDDGHLTAQRLGVRMERRRGRAADDALVHGPVDLPGGPEGAGHVGEPDGGRGHTAEGCRHADGEEDTGQSFHITFPFVMPRGGAVDIVLSKSLTQRRGKVNGQKRGLGGLDARGVVLVYGLLGNRNRSGTDWNQIQ